MKIYNVIEFCEPHNTDTYIGVYSYSKKESAIKKLKKLPKDTKRDWFKIDEDGYQYASELEWEKIDDTSYRCCNDRDDYYSVWIEEQVLNTR